MNAIEVKGLKKKYEDFELNIGEFSLPKGQILGLIGENGAGKSTLIKAILGLINRDEGEVNILGDDPAEHIKFKEKIGVVFDECQFPPLLNLKQMGKVLGSMHPLWEQKTYESYLEYFKLPTDKPINKFSRGMKMKASIAAALSHQAELLILDEATAGLDPVIRDEVLDVLLDFVENKDRAVLMSSHITSDLEKACDGIAFIRAGSIFMSGAKDDLHREHGILKCSKEEFEEKYKAKAVGFKYNSYGVIALMNRKELGQEVALESASLEEILLYSVQKESV